MPSSFFFKFKDRHLIVLNVFAIITVLFQVCYASSTGVKVVNWPVALFSNSGTFCVPSMNYPEFWTGDVLPGLSWPIRDGPDQSGAVGKPTHEFKTLITIVR
jgi:hypothetical protein